MNPLKKALIKLDTARKLGLGNIASVISYRVRLRLRLHKACLLKENSPSGPFFEPADCSAPTAPPVTSWISSAKAFGHICIPLNESPPDWRRSVTGSSSSDIPLISWWKIADFNEKAGDIKAIWELSRFDWVLAFSQHYMAGDSNAIDRLNTWLDDWVKENPPYLGPNWKCGQEASIRVIHLCVALILMGKKACHLPGFHHLIEIHLKRIVTTFNYAKAQQNNHGTTEAVAIFIGGIVLTESGVLSAQYYENLGRNYIEERSKALVMSDGSFSQYSTNYHRLVLDSFSIAEVWRRSSNRKSFSADFQKACGQMTNWLFQLVTGSGGEVPNIGANDGARLMPLTDSSHRDFRPSVNLASELFLGASAFPNNQSCNDHLSWLGINGSAHSRLHKRNCDFDDGGYKVLRRGQAVAIMRFPKFKFRPSQSDALHVDFWLRGQNLLEDAGSCSYSSEEQLAYFSGSIAHNTIQFDGRDQMPKLGRFLYGKWLTTEHLGSVREIKNGVICSVGYRDYLGASHYREILLGSTSLVVHDQVKGFSQRAVLRWRLASGAWEIIEQTDPYCVEFSSDLGSIFINSSSPLFGARIAEGWSSHSYLQMCKVSVFEVEVKSESALSTEFRWSQ